MWLLTHSGAWSTAFLIVDDATLSIHVDGFGVARCDYYSPIFMGGVVIEAKVSSISEAARMLVMWADGDDVDVVASREMPKMLAVYADELNDLHVGR